MADHFYSVAGDGTAFQRDRSVVTVGTSSTAGNHMELRVTDGSVTKQQLYEFLEFLSDFVSSGDALFTSNTPFTG